MPPVVKVLDRALLKNGAISRYVDIFGKQLECRFCKYMVPAHGHRQNPQCRDCQAANAPISFVPKKNCRTCHVARMNGKPPGNCNAVLYPGGCSIWKRYTPPPIHPDDNNPRNKGLRPSWAESRWKDVGFEASAFEKEYNAVFHQGEAVGGFMDYDEDHDCEHCHNDINNPKQCNSCIPVAPGVKRFSHFMHINSVKGSGQGPIIPAAKTKTLPYDY